MELQHATWECFCSFVLRLQFKGRLIFARKFIFNCKTIKTVNESAVIKTSTTRMWQYIEISVSINVCQMLGIFYHNLVSLTLLCQGHSVWHKIAVLSLSPTFMKTCMFTTQVKDVNFGVNLLKVKVKMLWHKKTVSGA